MVVENKSPGKPLRSADLSVVDPSVQKRKRVTRGPRIRRGGK